MEILLIVQIIIVVALVATILIQRSDSDGFTGNSSPTAFMTGRSQANLFTKTTAILATLFLLNSLVLGYIASHTVRTSDIIDEAVQEVEGKASEAEEVSGESDESQEEIQNLEVPDEIDEAAGDIEESTKDATQEIQKDIEPIVPTEDN